ncbi:hypothetical protein GTY54_29690, partial [Streptomyces sp. SID625]|nr:hypothetical protein [Streptomyces sp. SID625]
TTRRVAVPLLELLDAHGHTERLDDRHRRCRPQGHKEEEAGDGGGRESNPIIDPIVTCGDAGNRDK